MRDLKACTKCGESKPKTAYHTNKMGKDGLQSHCKECVRERSAAWNKNNKERKAQWRRDHPEADKKSKLKTRDKRLESARASYYANRDEILEHRRSMYDSSENAKRQYELWAETASTATNWGEEWTGAQLEIAIRTDVTIMEISKMIGRTYFAIVDIRQKVKREDPRTMALLGHDIY